MYSQNNEEEVIVNYFKLFSRKQLKFMEIGAYDPFKFSNTRRLVEEGWSGFYVDPLKATCDKFRDEYAANTGIIVLQAAVTVADQGPMTFYQCSDPALSTTLKSHADKWSKSDGVSYTEITVPTIAIADLVYIQQSIDFMSIDVEGESTELFFALPKSILESISMVCVEHDGHDIAIVQHAARFGLDKVLLHNGENIIVAQ